MRKSQYVYNNDNFYTFFSLSWLKMLNLPASLQNKNTRIGPFPWKRSVLQNPDRERTNQSTGICLGLGLPYNNALYYYVVSKILLYLSFISYLIKYLYISVNLTKITHKQR